MLLPILILSLVFLISFIYLYSSYLPIKKTQAVFQSLLPNSSLLLLKTPTTPKNMDGDQDQTKKKKKVENINTTNAAGRTQSIISKANEELKQVFTTFDQNGDGFLTKQEIHDSLKMIGMGIDSKEVDDMVEKLDSNGDGLIDVDEFRKLFETVSQKSAGFVEEGRGGGGDGSKGDDDVVDEDEDLKHAFNVFDGDKDGVISVDELSLVLSSLGMKEGNRIQDCEKMINMVDMDGDGMVNFDEFKKMMKAGGLGKMVS